MWKHTIINLMVSLQESNTVMKGTRRTETSKYPEEKKTTVIPRVVASEIGGAQTVRIILTGYGPRK